MRAIVLSIVASALCAAPVWAADEVKVAGKVDAVTLYRGQALVTRVVSFDAPKGAVQLVVTDLPESVVPQSLHATAGKGVQVRAVRYRARARSEAPKAEVRALDDELKKLNESLRENAAYQQLHQQNEAYLDSLRGFVAPTVKTELAKGVLNADTLDKITGMMFDLRGELAKQKFDLAEDGRKSREKIELLLRKRRELTRTHSKTDREALVFIDKAAAGKGDLQLRYLVNNATWEPVYNLRSSPRRAKVNVEYAALARQMTGEDWSNVTLTLSAAVARMAADGPRLAPLRVPLVPKAGRYETRALEQATDANPKILGRQFQTMQRTFDRDEQIRLNWDMNAAANSFQGNELIVRPEDVYAVQGRLGGARPSLSANYKLEGRVSFASRRENQLIEIAQFDVPAEFYYQAAPLLSEYVFRYARLANNSKLALLAGRSNVYFDGDFVGTGAVPMVARGQKVVVGFGMDPQLRAWREFVSKKHSDEWIGGKRHTTLVYRLVLHNYSDKAVSVRVVDRTPVPTDQLKVEVVRSSNPLSKDPEYLRTRRPRGILRWELSVPAGAAAAKPRIIDYVYTLTYGKGLHIGLPQAAAADQEAVKKEFMEALSVGKM